MNDRGKNIISDSSGGVALILVIWVMIVLIAIVTEFSYSMRTELNITKNFKDEEEAYQLALAGIEYAKAEMMSAGIIHEVSLNEDGVLIFDRDAPEPVRAGKLGGGGFEYTINDEDRKLDINIATHEQLKYIFTKSGLDPDDASAVADSIIDWRDSNDLHRLNGAEEDYYRGLDDPYSCKDGLFDTIEELLLVKGMTEEILYGSMVDEEEKQFTGVADAITVNGTSKVNVNTAPREVIEAVMGIEAADNLLLQREAGPVTSIPAGGKTASEFFTIISKGSSADGSIKRSVKAVVHSISDKMEIVYWNDNYIR